MKLAIPQILPMGQFTPQYFPSTNINIQPTSLIQSSQNNTPQNTTAQNPTQNNTTQNSTT